MNDNDRTTADLATHTTALHRTLLNAKDQPRPHRGLQEPPAAAGVSPDSGVLVITRGPNAGARFLLTRDISAAGRHPDSEIFLDDITVSRHHVEFRWLDHEYWIIDVGSLNGTYLNRVSIQSRPLSDGDVIQIGKFRMIFTCQQAQRR